MKLGARGIAFGALALALALASVGLRIAIASREWFYGDDFFFLTWVRSAHFSWSETFLPSSGRLVAYRPLGLDGYFVANFAAFGLHAFGYYLTGLVLQTLTAFGVLRIALHYRVERRVALASALLVLIAKPSSTATYEVADHNYICAAFATTLALVGFLEYLRRRSAAPRWASCVMFAIAVLCNEISVCMPLVAFLAALFVQQGHLVERARKSTLALWPHLVVLVLFLDFRISGVPAGPRSWFYEIDVGLDMLSNTRGNLEYILGGTFGFYATVALFVVGAAFRLAAYERSVPFNPSSSLVQLGLVSAVWLAATLLPFTVLALPMARFALALLPPTALLLACICEALLPLLRPEWRTPALLVALALLVPWRDLNEHLDRPRGAVFRDAHAVAAQVLRANTQASCVTIVCNGPGLANASQCASFRDGAFNSGLWTSVDPTRGLEVDYSESGSESFLEQVRNVHDCVRFYLKRDLTVSTDPARGAVQSTLLSAR